MDSKREKREILIRTVLDQAKHDITTRRTLLTTDKIPLQMTEEISCLLYADDLVILCYTNKKKKTA